MFPAQPASPPGAYSAADAGLYLKQWQELAGREEYAALSGWMRNAARDGSELRPLLDAVFGNSAYLTRLLLLYPYILHDMAALGADQAYKQLLAGLHTIPPDALMRDLRIAKAKTALLVALADLAGEWTLDKVTAALSDLAETALTLTVDSLLAAAHERGEITLPHPTTPPRKGEARRGAFLHYRASKPPSPYAKLLWGTQP